METEFLIFGGAIEGTVNKNLLMPLRILYKMIYSRKFIPTPRTIFSYTTLLYSFQPWGARSLGGPKK